MLKSLLNKVAGQHLFHRIPSVAASACAQQNLTSRFIFSDIFICCNIAKVLG